MEAEPVLEITAAELRFAGEFALDAVNFRLFAGEVHSLMGENGAGKSTLIRAFTGALRLESGKIQLQGHAVEFPNPAAAQLAGISTVYQEIDVLPNLTVAENIMLGREPRRFGFIDWKRMRTSAAEALSVLGVDIDPASRLSSHRLATQQMVAIARAISADVKVLVLDEPTSSLDQDEVAELFRVIRELKARGVAILFVSHFLEQVYEICDRITVLRNGRLVGEYLTPQLLRIDLIQKMLGSNSDRIDILNAKQSPPMDRDGKRVILRARGIAKRARLPITDLEVFEGELLGLAGLLGSGRTELARLLVGVDVIEVGELTIDGVRRRFRKPRQALNIGLAYSSENRRSEGIITELTLRENINLALQAERGWFRRIPQLRQEELTASWIEALDIRPTNPEGLAGHLSGGNQQKLILARLLALAPRLIALDEPTRGIDIGAKIEIQHLITDLADAGLAVIFISAELEEVLRVAHRILVLRDRQIVATVNPNVATIEMLLSLVAKVEDDE